MESLSGKKIFLLYPDEFLRKVFYGELRNRFTIYYMYDYEKIRPLADYYPESIIVLNLINNDLEWLPEELGNQLRGVAEDHLPTMIALHDKAEANCPRCGISIDFNGDTEALKARLKKIFEKLGGKGRRNFVRYGGNGENIASITLTADEGVNKGVVHDISASGLSCSFPQAEEIPANKDFNVKLGLGEESIIIKAYKILERDFQGDAIHVMKFREGMPAEETDMLLNFIYSSLDQEMKLFIKKLSN